MLSASPEVSTQMGVSDCEEGKLMLKAAAQPNSELLVREAFLEHIKHCHLCNAGRVDPCDDYTRLIPVIDSAEV